MSPWENLNADNWHKQIYHLVVVLTRCDQQQQLWDGHTFASRMKQHRIYSVTVTMASRSGGDHTQKSMKEMISVCLTGCLTEWLSVCLTWFWVNAITQKKNTGRCFWFSLRRGGWTWWQIVHRLELRCHSRKFQILCWVYPLSLKATRMRSSSLFSSWTFLFTFIIHTLLAGEGSPESKHHTCS